MNSLIKSALYQRKFIVILSIAIILLGFFTYFNMPKQENPEAISPIGMITTVYPGARAEEVKLSVTEEIENSIAGITGVEKIQSISRDNVSLVIVQLSYEVDKEKQWELLRTKLQALNLPNDVEASSLNTDLINTTGVILSINTKEEDVNSSENIHNITQDIKSKLNNLEEIEKTTIEGILDENIIIDIKLDQLSNMNITIEEVYDILRAKNIDLPLGSINEEGEKRSISYNKGQKNLRDIENIIIGIEPNTVNPIYLKNIAEIYYQYEEDTTFSHNDKSSILITSYFDKDSNILSAEEKINSIISDAEKESKGEIDINKIIFQPQDVKDSVNNFMINLLQAVVLVLLVVLIGMGYKNALVVSVTIPLSIMLTILSMSILDIKIQQISIAALIISLGILVDNSIVITDAIQVKLDENIDIKRAVYLGTKESSIPVLTSTLTTIMAFVPLIALPGEAGEFAKSLPQVVILALMASYIVSITVTPVLASLILKNSHRKVRNKRFMKGKLEKILKGSMKYSKTTFLILIVLIVLIVLAGLLVANMKLEIFPYADNNIAYIDVEGDRSNVESTKDTVEEVKDILKDQGYVEEYISSIGGPIPKFYITNPPYFKSPSFGQIMFRFDEDKISEYDNKKYFAYELQNILNSEVEKGEATVNLLALTNPGPDIDITITGDEFSKVSEIGDNLKVEMDKMESLYNIKIEKSNKTDEYEITPNNTEMSRLGITDYDVQRQINLALNETKIGEVEIENKYKNIIFYGNPIDIEELKGIPIKSKITNDIVPLNNISDFKTTRRLEEIKRFNRKSYIKITADVNPEYSTLIEQDRVEEIINKQDTKGMNISFGGEKEIFKKYLNGLGVAALIALIGVYLILLLQFKSLLQPLIILITVPLSVIGVILGVFIFRLPLTFTVGLGAASLIGIVVNNAILIIEYINRERKERIDIKEACIESAKKRLRPIMLSSITTVIGLIPLVLSGSSFFTPLAVGLMVGLIFSTLLTLIIIPVAYSCFIKD